VIGGDRRFPPCAQEGERLASEPDLWRRIIDFVEAERFVIAEECGIVLYFCPFGLFPRSYEVVDLETQAMLCEVPADRWMRFADLLHRVLRVLGDTPLDYEIHAGPDIPLHAHVNARWFPYSNIGGTLNLPHEVAAQDFRQAAER